MNIFWKNNSELIDKYLKYCNDCKTLYKLDEKRMDADAEVKQAVYLVYIHI